MSDENSPAEESFARGAVELACADLAATVTFFTEDLGLRVDSVEPADDPVAVVVSGHGLCLRLVRGGDESRGVVLRVPGVNGERVAPNGVRVLPPAVAALEVPGLRAAFTLSRLADAAWHEGRAGMAYRDLIPDRQGGRFVASHIRIADGGDVPDYVHHHDVCFQLLFCWRGEVRVVYEDQGPPLVMRPGDCVVQPPHIRHRVLECSPGFEIVEVTSPAAHPTFADHRMTLPTGRVRPRRDFGGQRFLHDVVANATWRDVDGGAVRDLGVASATGGAAAVRVVRGAGPCPGTDAAELRMTFVLDGSVILHRVDEPSLALTAGDCVVVPAGVAHHFEAAGPAPELLQVTAPAP